jgi:glycosyltransferase involved in cell wall biosynthesis
MAGALMDSTEQLIHRSDPANLRIVALCGGSYISGLEIKTLNLLSALQARGNTILCLTSAWNDGDFIGRLSALNIPFDTFHFGTLTKSLQPEHLWWMCNTIWHWPGSLWKLHRILRRFQPQVILLFNRDSALLAAPVLYRWPCVFHAGEVPAPTRWVRHLYSTINLFVNSWIGNSYFVAKQLQKLSVPTAKIHVVYNGLPSWVAPDRSPSETKQELLTIGICGQIGPWKGHDDLVDALGQLAIKGYKFKCLIFGRGNQQYIDTLLLHATRNGIADRVEVRGFVENLPEMYKMIDILAVPSRFEEPFGNVAAEAGLNGIPVVVTRRGGLPEIVVDGETGFIVEAEAPPELADRLARLLESCSLRKQMGAAAQRRIQELFTIEAMAAGHERVLRKAIAEATVTP